MVFIFLLFWNVTDINFFSPSVLHFAELWRSYLSSALLSPFLSFFESSCFFELEILSQFANFPQPGKVGRDNGKGGDALPVARKISFPLAVLTSFSLSKVGQALMDLLIWVSSSNTEHGNGLAQRVWESFSKIVF